MVRVFSKHNNFLTKKGRKKSKEGIVTETVSEEKWLGFKELKIPASHREGYCKLCHKSVKNLEAHIKKKHI